MAGVQASAEWQCSGALTGNDSALLVVTCADWAVHLLARPAHVSFSHRRLGGARPRLEAKAHSHRINAGALLCYLRGVWLLFDEFGQERVN